MGRFWLLVAFPLLCQAAFYEIYADDDGTAWRDSEGTVNLLQLVEGDTVFFNFNSSVGHYIVEYYDRFYSGIGRNDPYSDPIPYVQTSVPRNETFEYAREYYFQCETHKPNLRLAIEVRTEGGSFSACPGGCPEGSRCYEGDSGFECREVCGHHNCSTCTATVGCSYCHRWFYGGGCIEELDEHHAGCDEIITSASSCPVGTPCGAVSFDTCGDCVSDAGSNCKWCQITDELNPASWICANFTSRTYDGCIEPAAEDAGDCPPVECADATDCSGSNRQCLQGFCVCLEGYALALDQDAYPGCVEPSCLTAGCPPLASCIVSESIECECPGGYAFNSSGLCDADALCVNVTCPRELVCKAGGCQCPPGHTNSSGTCTRCHPPNVIIDGECVCFPDCAAKQESHPGETICGDDGCGGSCGECASEEVCSAMSTCGPPCTPNCGSRICGDDGCGGSCGICERGLFCHATSCETYPCESTCARQDCGVGPCGALDCGACAEGLVCNATNQCEAASSTTTSGTTGSTANSSTSTTGVGVQSPEAGATVTDDEKEAGSSGAVVGAVFGVIGGLMCCAVLAAVVYRTGKAADNDKAVKATGGEML